MVLSMGTPSIWETGRWTVNDVWPGWRKRGSRNDKDKDIFPNTVD